MVIVYSVKPGAIYLGLDLMLDDGLISHSVEHASLSVALINMC